MIILKPDYVAHEDLVGPARSTPELWRLGFGIVIAAGLYLLLSQVYFNVVFIFLSPETRANLSGAGTASGGPVEMLVLLFQFICMTIAVLAIALGLHKRGLSTLVGPFGKALAQFMSVLPGLGLLTIVFVVLGPYDLGEPLLPGQSMSTWLLLLPFALMAIFVQSASEEVLFRGYIQQQLAARFDNPLIWLIVPAGLFALAHYAPASFGSNAGLVALWAFVFGLLMADLTARAGTIGPAVALHMFNNVWALLIVSMPDEMSGLSLYQLPYSASDELAIRALLPIDFVAMVIMWLIARLAIRR